MSEGVLDESLTVKKQFSDDTTPIDKDDIIDVSTFDFVDTDRWLCVPLSSEECKVHDLHAWLRNETDSVLPRIDISNKKYVDTRTFTRPKKRTLPSTTEEFGANSAQNISYAGESVPSILKPLPTMRGSVSSIEISGPASGPESMEVYLTMSESKEIDSFINLTEPGFSDAIMNVSEPSILYSSIISLPKEESVSMHNSNDGDNPGNVSLSTAHISNDLEATVNSTNMDDTFSRIGNIVITKSESHNKMICDENHLNNMSGGNKYNAYKKESAADRLKVNKDSTYIHEEDALPKRKMPERKYFTFTKKTAKAEEKSSEPLNNLDETKTFSKLQQSKTNVPGMLRSKLPQFLQKSNPNLVSGSGKTTDPTSCTNVANITSMKGSQPNIVRVDIEPSLSTKGYVLEKMRSGSEQRLLELNSNPTDFQLIGAGGSPSISVGEIKSRYVNNIIFVDGSCIITKLLLHC